MCMVMCWVVLSNMCFMVGMREVLIFFNMFLNLDISILKLMFVVILKMSV